MQFKIQTQKHIKYAKDKTSSHYNDIKKSIEDFSRIGNDFYQKALKEQMLPEAKNHILYRFILDAVKQNENIVVEDKEVDEEIKKLLKAMAQ